MNFNDQRLIDRAEAMGGAKLVEQVFHFNGYDEYLVRGRNDLYSVFVDSKFSCTCPTGQRGNGCYHLGCAYLRRIADSIVVEPVVPAPAPKMTTCPACGGGYDAAFGGCLNAKLFGDCDNIIGVKVVLA
jgi:hypothetical protein